MAVVILIPAAGASSRMRGRDKVVELLDGEPLLRRQARLAASVSPLVIVTIPRDNHARRDVLEGLEVKIIALSPEMAGEGMAASLRIAAHQDTALSSATAMMVWPADMPEIDASDLRRLMEVNTAHPDVILRGATSSGTAGHPVVFPRTFWPELAELRGDHGARSVLAAHSDKITLVPLPERHALTDLDTPEDWAAWRTSRSK